MPTTTTATTSTSRGPVNVAQAMKAGEAAPATRVRSRGESTAAYVKAMKGACGFHKQALQHELAVCLAFYAAKESADKKTKAELRPIYEKAGFECKTKEGADYQTVQRRISVAADLFTHLGGAEGVIEWTQNESGDERFPMIVKGLEKLKLNSIQAIQALVGKTPRKGRGAAKKATPAAQTDAGGAEAGDDDAQEAMNEMVQSSNQREAAGGPAAVAATGRRATDRLPGDRVLRTEHVTVAIPFDATKDELTKLATDILAFAAHMQAEAVVAH